MSVKPAPRHFRAIFLSDIHLGTRGCQAEMLLDFLRHHDAETFYLVGDIVDGWRLKRMGYWPQAHNDVVQKLMRKGRKGARIVYTPGNHDEFLRDFLGTRIAKWWMPDDVAFVDEIPHTATGKIQKTTLRDQFAAYKLPA